MITHPIPDSLEPAIKDNPQIPRTKHLTSDQTTIRDEAPVHKSIQTFEDKAGLSKIASDGMEEISIFDGRDAEDVNQNLKIAPHSKRKYQEKLVEATTISNPSVKQPYERGNSFRPLLAENHYLHMPELSNNTPLVLF